MYVSPTYTIPCFSAPQNLSNLDRAMSMTSDTEEGEGRDGVSETIPLPEAVPDPDPEPDPDTVPVPELSLFTPDLLSSSEISSGYGSGDFQPVQNFDLITSMQLCLQLHLITDILGNVRNLGSFDSVALVQKFNGESVTK